MAAGRNPNGGPLSSKKREGDDLREVTGSVNNKAAKRLEKGWNFAEPGRKNRGGLQNRRTTFHGKDVVQAKADTILSRR